VAHVVATHQAGSAVSGRYIEVLGLLPGAVYGLRVRAVVSNCDNKTVEKQPKDEEDIADEPEADYELEARGEVEEVEKESSECILESDLKAVEVMCKYRCKDGSCINRNGGPFEAACGQMFFWGGGEEAI
jgi:hypothetical protein